MGRSPVISSISTSGDDFIFLASQRIRKNVHLMTSLTFHCGMERGDEDADAKQMCH